MILEFNTITILHQQSNEATLLSQLHQYFKTNKYLIKENHQEAIEIWIPNESIICDKLNHYKKYQLQIQKNPFNNQQSELKINFIGYGQICKTDAKTLIKTILPPETIKWVYYQHQIYDYTVHSNTLRRDQNQVYPVVNSDIQNKLKLHFKESLKSTYNTSIKELITFNK